MYVELMQYKQPCPKKHKTSESEKAMDKILEGCLTFQKESEKSFIERDEQRWTREMELEEKKRRGSII